MTTDIITASPIDTEMTTPSVEISQTDDGSPTEINCDDNLGKMTYLLRSYNRVR
jgi:hypothetical protein